MKIVFLKIVFLICGTVCPCGDKPNWRNGLICNLLLVQLMDFEKWVTIWCHKGSVVRVSTLFSEPTNSMKFFLGLGLISDKLLHLGYYSGTYFI